MEEMKTKEENMLAEEKEREVGREKMQRRKEGKEGRKGRWKEMSRKGDNIG